MSILSHTFCAVNMNAHQNMWLEERCSTALVNDLTLTSIWLMIQANLQHILSTREICCKAELW